MPERESFFQLGNRPLTTRRTVDNAEICVFVEKDIVRIFGVSVWLYCSLKSTLYAKKDCRFLRWQQESNVHLAVFVARPNQEERRLVAVSLSTERAAEA